MDTSALFMPNYLEGCSERLEIEDSISLYSFLGNLNHQAMFNVSWSSMIILTPIGSCGLGPYWFGHATLCLSYFLDAMICILDFVKLELGKRGVRCET